METREMVIQELREDLNLAIKVFGQSPEITREILNKIDKKLEALGFIPAKELARLAEPIRKQKLLETIIDFQKYLQEKNKSMKNLVNEDGKLK